MRLEDFFAYHSFRPGQKELASAVYEACKRGEHFVSEAISGFGKTAAVLSGSLLATREDSLRILYTCRTKRQVIRVTEELSNIQRRTPVKAASLFSKYDYCLLKKRSSHPVPPDSFKWYCNFNVSNNLCSYFLNVGLIFHQIREFVEESSKNFPTHSLLLQESERIHVCPYEIAKLAMTDAEIVATTYHYAFDPNSKSLLSSSMMLNPSKTILIVDEAHNLRDFLHSLTTTSLTFEELNKSISDSRSFYLENVTKSLTTLKNRITDFCSNQTGWHVDKETFVDAISESSDKTWLSNLALELSASARIGWTSVFTRKSLPTSIVRMGEFITSLLSSAELDNLVLTKSSDSIDLVNVDPTKLFRDATKDFRGLVLLSATASPSNIFLRSIGLQEDTTTFHKTEFVSSLRIKTIIDFGVTTRFKCRTPEMYSKIASKIISIASCCNNDGGIGIFVPSYAVLHSLLEPIKDSISGRNICVESRTLTAQDSNEIIESFKSHKGSVLIAVQGGRFSEGEDFPGQQMDVSIVVGLSPLPPSPMVYAEYSYLKKIGMRDSYLMISLLPALRKAFQSAGRHIRDPNKKGLVFLLDSRFKDERIIALMPSWLKKDVTMGDFSSSQIAQIINNFL